MAMQTYRAGNRATFTDSGNATITLTLPAPGAGRAWVIDSMLCHGLGAITVFKVEVTTNGGTTIAASGGQVVAGERNLFGGIPGPIVTLVNDAPKVVFTATGANPAQCTVNAHIENA